jgi:uncharacterized protein YndB with AHSA1/START domain
VRNEISVVINRPIEEVFAFTTNQENQPKWQSRLLEMTKTSDGPIGVGTTWRSVVKFLGRTIEATTVITEYEPNKTYTGRSTSGPIPGGARQSYEEVEGGTRLTFTLEAEPGGFFKIAEPVLLNLYKRQAEAEMASLKEFMEAGLDRTT